MKKILIILLFLSTSAKAEENYTFNDNQKLRIATTILISQGISRGLSELNIGLKGRLLIGNALILGPAITAELLNQKISKNNLLSVGIGVVTSNLLSVSFDW